MCRYPERKVEQRAGREPGEIQEEREQMECEEGKEQLLSEENRTRSQALGEALEELPEEPGGLPSEGYPILS